MTAQILTCPRLNTHTLSPQKTPADPKDPPRAATEICRGKCPVEEVQRFPLKNKIIPHLFPPQLEPSRAALWDQPGTLALQPNHSPSMALPMFLSARTLGEKSTACLRQTEHLLRGQPSKQPTNANSARGKCQNLSEQIGFQRF